MKAMNSVTVNFSLRDYPNVDKGFPHPRDVKDPEGLKRCRGWVVDTICESIYILYEFESPQLKKAFKENPPAVFAEATIAERTQAYYDHWCDGVMSNPNTWYIDSN